MTFQLASLHVTARPGIPRTAAAVYPCGLTGLGFWATDFAEFADTAALRAGVSLDYTHPPGTVEGDLDYALNILNATTDASSAVIDAATTFNGGHTVKSKAPAPGLRGLEVSGEYFGAYGATYTGPTYPTFWARARAHYPAGWAGKATAQDVAYFYLMPDAPLQYVGAYTQSGRLYVYEWNGSATTEHDVGPDTLLYAGAFTDLVCKVEALGGADVRHTWWLGASADACAGTAAPTLLGSFTKTMAGAAAITGVNFASIFRHQIDASLGAIFWWWALLELVDGAAHPDPFNLEA